MTEIKPFIRSEFYEHFDKFDVDVLWNLLSKCKLNFTEDLLLQNPDKIS